MRFRPNPRLEQEILALPGVRAHLAAAAQQVAGRVRQVAPHRTGDYAASIEVDGTTVGSTDAAAVPIEFGSQNNPVYAPLRRGVLAAGLTFKDAQ